MNSKETLFAKRQKTKAIREAWRDKGLCIVCGRNQVGLNNDGTTSVRCPKCREQMAVRKSRYRAPSGAVKVFDGETQEIFDTIQFKAYSLAIRQLLAKHGEITTRMVHEALGYDKQAWTIAAIKSIGNIAESGVLVTRYRIEKPRVVTAEVDGVKFNEYRRWLREKSLYVPSDLFRGVNG